MRDVGCARAGERLVVAGLLAALLAACSGASQLELSAGGGNPPAKASEPEGAAASSFQGAVAAVDPGVGTLVVDVQIVWTPVLEARRHERRVTAGPQTRWDPGVQGLGRLVVGDEVQVDASEGVDGIWRAVRVRLLDID